MLDNYIRPSFLIIGERKCGTSSLYRYLIDHQQILPCKLKEPQFFSNSADYIKKNIDSYFKLFPTKDYLGDISFDWPELNPKGVLYHEMVTIERDPEIKDYLTGEASANVLFEVDPELIYKYLPEIKIIILLRNPVDRAFSQYRMYKRFFEEGRDIGMELTTYQKDLIHELHKIKDGEVGEFLSPSIYINSINKWYSVFPKSQIQILFTEEMEKINTLQLNLSSICNFLQIKNFNESQVILTKFNLAPKKEMKTEIYRELMIFFEPFDQILQEAISLKLPWRK